MSCGVYVYGDSLMKATMPDQAFRYHFHLPELADRYRGLALTNRSKMGATAAKGLALVERDLERGLDARYALVAYGGNDSDFHWDAVAAAPEAEHLPRTEPDAFRALLDEITGRLRQAGVQPVLMTLPPIDAERYLAFICRGGLSRERILRWLGDVQHIYRFQEAYSQTVAALARERGLPLIDVRRRFLLENRLPQLIAADGIHLTMPGYMILYDVLTGWLRQEMGGLL